MKKDILKNAKPGTRIFNQETGLYYVKTRKGTWQKDDNFFTGVLPRRLSTKEARDAEFSNQIAEDGSFDLSKQGFTITDDHPLAEKLRSSEQVRVDVRDKLAIQRKEKEEKKVTSDRRTYLTNKIAELESDSTTFNYGAYRSLDKSKNQVMVNDILSKYQEELKELDKPKTIKGKKGSVVKPTLGSSFYFTDKYEKDNDVDPQTKKEIDQGKAELQKLFGVQL